MSNALEKHFEKWRDLKRTHIFIQETLNGIEEKHDTAKSWIQDNKKSIILTYEKLCEMIDNDDTAGVRNLLSDDKYTEFLGVVLDIKDDANQRLSTRLLENFPRSKKIEEYVCAVKLGIPQKVFKIIDKNVKKKIETRMEEVADGPENSGWLSRMLEKDVKSLQLKIENVKTDILRARNQKSYYKAVNQSIKDWTLDKILLDKPEPAPEMSPDELLTQFKKAEFVMGIAQNDFEETLRTFSEELNFEAKDYRGFKAAVSITHKDDLKGTSEFSFQNIANALDKPGSKKYTEWFLEGINHDSITAYFYKRLGMNQVMLRLFDYLMVNQDADQLKKIKISHNSMSETVSELFHSFLKVTQKDYADLAYDRYNLSIIKRLIENAGFNFDDEVIGNCQLYSLYNAGINSAAKRNNIYTLLDQMDIAHKDTLDIVLGAADQLAQYFKNAGKDNDLSFLVNLDHVHIQQAYGLAQLMLKEEFGMPLSRACLNNPENKNSAKNFLILLEVGLTHDIQDEAGMLRSILKNSIVNKEWNYILPKIYNSLEEKNSDVLFDSLTEILLADDTPLFDDLYKNSGVNELNRILSFITSPMERASFYLRAAEKTQDQALKQAYIDNVAEIDGELLEYAPGSAIVPANTTNVYYADNKVYAHVGDEKVVLSNFRNVNHIARLFSAFERYGFLNTGLEMIAPQKIDYAELKSENGETWLDTISGSSIFRVYVADDVDQEALLEKIICKNDNILRINNSLIDTTKLTLVTKNSDDESLYFINGRYCVDSFDMSEKQYNKLAERLLDNDQYIQIGEQFINLAAIDAVQYDEATETLSLRAKGTTFQNITMVQYKNDSIPRIEVETPSLKAKEFKALADKLLKSNFIDADNNIYMNAANIVCMERGTLNSQDVYAVKFKQDDKGIVVPYQANIKKDLTSKIEIIDIRDDLFATDNVYYVDFSGQSNNLVIGLNEKSHSYNGVQPNVYRAAVAQSRIKRQFAKAANGFANLDKVALVTAEPHENARVNFTSKQNIQLDKFYSRDLLDKLWAGEKRTYGVGAQTRSTTQAVKKQSISREDILNRQARLSRSAQNLLAGTGRVTETAKRSRPAKGIGITEY